MLPPGVKIVGISRCDVSQDESDREGCLYLELVASDGIIYKTWWPQSAIARFVTPVEQRGAPLGATRQ